MNKLFFDRSTVNIMALAFLSFTEALQILIIVAFIFSFIPIPVPDFVQKLFPLSLYDVRLERESFLYHIWIAAGLGLQAVLMLLHRKRLDEAQLWRPVVHYACFMAGLIVIQIFAVFKIFLWGNPWWARDLLYVFLGLGILARIFWPEFRRLMTGFWNQPSTQKIPPWGYCLMDAGVMFILAVLVFTPDLSEVLARMFSYDKFYHLDGFVLSPAWAHHQGLVLNKDVTSEYSLVMPIVFDSLLTWMGGFSYAHAVGLMIALSAIYYFLLYGFWRYWSGSFGLAVFAFILSIKLQFFHWGVVPLIWIYPNATPVRFLPDIFFLFFLLRFTQGLDLRWLTAAAFASGIGLVWTMDVGVYMFGTFLVAVASGVYLKGIKILPKAVALILMPWGIALGILFIFYGSLALQGQFWHNTFEFMSLFMQGWGALPITEGLKDKQFFAFCMGFLIPIVYTGTLLYSSGMFLFRQSRPHWWMVLICIYGLGLYHYFIHRSGVTSYYAVVIPFIFVVLFWLQAVLGQIQENWQKAIKLFLCAWALTALITGYLYTYYPNFLNLSAFDWAPEKKFYTEQCDFRQDAAFIDALTEKEAPVALISSFETKILMQADRRPFFYYFPMVESEHMQGEKLRGIYLHTHARLERTLKQFQGQKPAYVFIQTRLWQGPDARQYENSNEGFKLLMAYIRAHYQYQSQGQYLTALHIL
jgi:hypothetical protein